MDWPEWWKWPIEVSSHCLKRMQERRFNEADLRAMVHEATELKEQSHATFIVVTTHDHSRWEVIVAPDPKAREIIVVTAYPDALD